MKYTQVAAVVGKRMKPQANRAILVSPFVDLNEAEIDDVSAEYECAYVLLSNRYDAPSEVMGVASLRSYSVRQSKNLGCLPVIRQTKTTFTPT